MVTWLIGWFADWLIGWLNGRLVGWLAGRLGGWLTSRMVGSFFIGKLVSSSVFWLAGWVYYSFKNYKKFKRLYNLNSYMNSLIIFSKIFKSIFTLEFKLLKKCKLSQFNNKFYFFFNEKLFFKKSIHYFTIFKWFLIYKYTKMKFNNYVLVVH